MEADLHNGAQAIDSTLTIVYYRAGEGDGKKREG